MANGLSYDVFSFLKMRNQNDVPLPEPDTEGDILLRLTSDLSLQYLERNSPYWIRHMYGYMASYKFYDWYDATVKAGTYQLCIPYPNLRGHVFQEAAHCMQDAVPAPTVLVVSALLCIATTLPACEWQDYTGMILRCAEHAHISLDYMHASVRKMRDGKIEIFPTYDEYASTELFIAGLRTPKSVS